MKENSIEINYVQRGIEIKNEDIIDALITALEGGSNYWYTFKELLPYPIEHILLDILTTGRELIIYDVETEEELGILSRENIKRGLKHFIEDSYEFEPDMDADEADTLFQYIVMGEIVFG